MANKAAIAKNKKQITKLKNGNSPFKAVRYRNRCQVCGRARGYVRKFKMCRICLREKALYGELPGVKKFSW